MRRQENIMRDLFKRLTQEAKEFNPFIIIPTDNPSPFTIERLNILPLEKLQEMFESPNINRS